MPNLPLLRKSAECQCCKLSSLKSHLTYPAIKIVDFIFIKFFSISPEGKAIGRIH